jgi:hypothetical protein
VDSNEPSTRSSPPEPAETNVDLGPLDYVYAPSSDVAADARAFTDVLGAELMFAIDESGTRVAMLRLGSDEPLIILTDHLPDERSVLIYRVDDLTAGSAALEANGWAPERTIELPPGPCITLRSPGGQRVAIYERSRPGVVESMVGRRDF